MGGSIIQSGVSAEGVIRIKATPLEIGVKRKRQGRGLKIGEVVGVDIVVIIVGIQNDETTWITLSTS